MPKYIDQIGHKVEINSCNRIVSLVPSQTELLVDLGLEDKLVGITKFCIYPKRLKENKTIIGGTKDFKLDKIFSLKPDLVIANKEENTKDGIESLQKKIPVWTSDINTLEDALKMIQSIGKITNTESKANLINNQIKKLLGEINYINKTKRYVTYFIWKNPYMVVGQNNFINSILKLLNYQNLYDSAEKDRYQIIDIEELKKKKKLDIIILSSEPFPFKKSDMIELKKLFPNTKIEIVDGTIFSWYGSRLILSLKNLKNMLAEKS